MKTNSKVSTELHSLWQYNLFCNIKPDIMVAHGKLARLSREQIAKSCPAYLN